MWAHWFTPAEASQCRGDARPALAAALRFAVKEATYKAVGAEFTGPVRWQRHRGPRPWRRGTLAADAPRGGRAAADRVGARILHVSTCEVVTV